MSEKKFFAHYDFQVVDQIDDFELLALQFESQEVPQFLENARLMKINQEEFTIYYSPACPYVEYEVD